MIKVKNIAQKLMGLMRPISPISPMRLMSLMSPIWLLGPICLFLACSSGNDDDLMPETPVESAEKAGVPVGVMGLAPEFEEMMPISKVKGVHRAPEAMTRAWQPPVGYELMDNSENVIGVSFTENSADPINGHLFKSGIDWRANVTLEEKTYYLYGYVPHLTGINYSVLANGIFSSGAIMTLTNVPAIMPSDFCVIIGAKNGREDYRANEDYTVADLRRGKFDYAAKKIDEDGGEGNFIYLLFDHLYAGMSFHMRVHGDYDAVRTIKLKNIELQASDDTEPKKDKTTVVVTLAAKDDGTSPITGVTFTPTGDNTIKSSIFKSTAGHTLTTGYQNFPGYFMPKGVTKVILTCTYDVYDKNVTPEHPDGNLVRQDCKATNTLVLANLFDRFDEMRAGIRYNVFLTIHPSYLYVMSDPDLKDPEMVVD